MVRAFTAFMVFPLARRFYRLALILHLTLGVVAFSAAASSGAADLTPTITLSVSPARIDEGSAAVYTLTASTVNPDQATTINFSMGGKAVPGKHYVLDGSSSQVTIPAGAASANITLTSLSTSLKRKSKTATMTLKAGAGYGLSSANRASVTIVNVSASPTPTPTPTPDPSATPAPTPEQEVWIAVRTDGLAGSGTQLDPFNGSTPEQFDALMGSFYYTFYYTSNAAIHLTGPGPFRTDANATWLVRPGWVISGDGMYSTTVQVVGNVAGRYSVTPFRSNAGMATDNVTIRDLTIDCNWAELSTTADTGAGGEKNITVTAVGLDGSNNLLERVRCINSYGSAANRLEHFALFLAGPRNGDGTNNIIRECRAELPQGSYGNPFALAGWVWGPTNHLLTNSKVISCTAVGVNNGQHTGFTSGGVNIANVKDCEIDGNTFIDCFGVAYTDTGSIDGLRITNNTVIRGWQVVGLSNYTLPKQNIEISGNNFQVQNRLADGTSYGIVIGRGTTTNLTITHNTITFDSSGTGELYFAGITTSQLINATISDNTIGLVAGYLQNSATGIGITMFNNRMSDGTLIPTLNNQ